MLFLTKPEESYINYLEDKKVEISEYAMKSQESLEEKREVVKSAVREAMLEDKDLVDKS